MPSLFEVAIRLVSTAAVRPPLLLPTVKDNLPQVIGIFLSNRPSGENMPFPVRGPDRINIIKFFFVRQATQIVPSDDISQMPPAFSSARPARKAMVVPSGDQAGRVQLKGKFSGLSG